MSLLSVNLWKSCPGKSIEFELRYHFRGAIRRPVNLYKKRNSKYFWYSFYVRGYRYRGSTKEANQARAEKIGTLKFAEAMQETDPLPKKAPILVEFSSRFLEWATTSRLSEKSKAYYDRGWRLLSNTAIRGMRLDQISSDRVERITFNGSASYANCALRTLRRMLHKAEEWKLLRRAPRLKLLPEYPRDLRLDEAAEVQLIKAAEACKWPKSCYERFRDIVILMRDTGMRNERELYRIRIEDIDFEGKSIFVPDSKTPKGRRLVPMSHRVLEILRARCENRTEGWVFPSERGKSGHLTTLSHQFRKARRKAGLPEELVLYCARHDFGTRVLSKTGNLKAVMEVMGHKDVHTAMRYQHPDIEIVRLALNDEQNVKTNAGEES